MTRQILSPEHRALTTSWCIFRLTQSLVIVSVISF